MATAEKIKAAMDAGYSIDEIEQYLGNPGVVPKVATAFKAGYSPSDVDQYLYSKTDPQAAGGTAVSSTAERMADDSAVIPEPSWTDVAKGIVPAIVEQTPIAFENWWKKAGENLSAMSAESSTEVNPLTGAITDNANLGQPVPLSPASNAFLQETVKPAAMITAFVPGVNTVAVPVAGAFIVSDVINAALSEPGTMMVNGQEVPKSRIKNVLDVFGAEQIEQLFTNDPKLRESLLSDPLNTIGALLPVLLAGKTVANKTMSKTSKKLESKNIENKPIVEQVTEGMGTPEARGVITDPVTGVVRMRTQAEMGLPVEPYKPPTTPYITPAQPILPQETKQPVSEPTKPVTLNDFPDKPVAVVPVKEKVVNEKAEFTRQREIEAEKLRKQSPATMDDYQKVQDAIDAMEDSLIKKYGEETVFQTHIDPKQSEVIWGVKVDSKMTPAEIEARRQLYAVRDAIGQNIDNKNVNIVLDRLQNAGEGDRYTASQESVIKATKKIQESFASDQRWGNNISAADKYKEVVRDIYTSLSHDMPYGFPDALRGDIDAAIRVTKEWPNSVYGMNPEGLLNQAKTIADAIFKPIDEVPANKMIAENSVAVTTPSNVVDIKSKKKPLNEMQEYYDLIAEADGIPVRDVLTKVIEDYSAEVRDVARSLMLEERKGSSKIVWNEQLNRHERIIINKNENPIVQDFVSRNGRYPKADEWLKVAEDYMLRDNPEAVNMRLNMLDAKEYLDTLPVETKSKTSKKKSVEQALSEKVDAVIPPEKIQIGMTTKDVNIPIPPQQTVKPSFSDPVTEARYQAARKGLQAESIVDKVKNFFADSYNKATRQYEYLPPGAEFAPLKFDLSTLEKAKAVSADRAGRILQGLTIEMKGDKGAYDLFQRKVLLDDLAQTEGSLPFGFTKESVLSDKTSIDGMVANSPKVAKAIAERTAVWNELKANYIKAMGDIGFDVADRMSRQDYFRHQVLEYAKERAVTGNGSKLKTPTGSGFLRKRKGSEMDINANYLQAEFEVMAQMMHDIKTAKTIKKVENNYSIRDKVKKAYRSDLEYVLEKLENPSGLPDYDTLGNVKQYMKDNKIPGFQIENVIKQRIEELGGEGTLAKASLTDWRQSIPEGYTTWQPREGSSFYMAQSIPEKLASQILDGTLKEVLTPDQLKQVMAKGSPFKEFVVKEEVAKTLDKISTAQNEGNVFKFFRGITTPWKIWTLSSPTRIIKYNIRNAVGDADAVATMNPRAFSKVKQASSELYQTIYGDRSMTPEMKAWFERGGMETTLNIQELPQINQLKMFKDFGSDNPNVIKKVWNGYWDKAQTANTYREAILRYANYLEYLDQMKANGGKPKTFGASRPDEVMALKTLEDRAFKLSNETMGAYDSVSVLGKDLRATLLPFWSWSETNFTRYVQFLKNQAADGNIASTVAKKVGINALKAPLAVGSFAVKASAVWAGLQAYNMTMFPEEEKELSPVEQAKPHIILGRDKDGNVRYFNRLGSVGDFLEWFGLDSPAKDVTDFMNGTRTPGEIIKDMAKRPVNKLAQAVTPYIKTPAELATGKQTFPDIFNARSLKDVPNYLANSVGLSNEFKAISRSPVGEKLGMIPRPGKPYLESMPENLLLYKTEPGRNAYYQILEEKRRFLESKGESGSGDFNSPRTEIMRNYKQALKLGDKETADKLLDKYYEMGGTSKGYKQSMQSMSPLAGMDKKKQYEFMSTLTKEQLKEFSKAMQYYNDVLSK